MRRLVQALLAIILLLGFVGDLRVLAPVMAAVLVLYAVRRHVRVAWAEAALLVGAFIAFELDSEVFAWALFLTVAVVAGFLAATNGRVRQTSNLP